MNTIYLLFVLIWMVLVLLAMSLAKISARVEEIDRRTLSIVPRVATKECHHCHQLFEAGQGTGRRLDAKFCSDEHRVAFNSLKRSTGDVSP